MSVARTCVLLLLGACGCGNETDFDDDAAPSSGDAAAPPLLTVLRPEPAGANCGSAGQRTLVGLDTNANGSLEPGEVLSSSVVCNGAGVALPVATCPSRESRALPPAEASWHDSLEIVGPGFVALKGSGDDRRESYYARKLQVRLDKVGCLSTGEELRVQGYAIEPGGLPSSTLGDVCIRAPALPAVATTAVVLSVNLDANSTAPLHDFDPRSPASTSIFPSNFSAFDALGNAHQLTVYFVKTRTHDWEWHAVADGSDLARTPGTPFEGASGTLRFSDDGALEEDRQHGSTWTFVGTSVEQHIEFDFGDAIVDGGNGLAHTTNFASPSTTNAVTQNGYAAGSLQGLRMSDLGVFLGTYTNGQSRPLAQLPIANFPVADGLIHACNDLWVATPASGQAALGLPGGFDRGSFLPIVD